MFIRDIFLFVSIMFYVLYILNTKIITIYQIIAILFSYLTYVGIAILQDRLIKENDKEIKENFILTENEEEYRKLNSQKNSSKNINENGNLFIKIIFIIILDKSFEYFCVNYDKKFFGFEKEKLHKMNNKKEIDLEIDSSKITHEDSFSGKHIL